MREFATRWQQDLDNFYEANLKGNENKFSTIQLRTEKVGFTYLEINFNKNISKFTKK